ncbi:MAG: copB [Myxococcaceae bacterium]|nr:copB [Myxococcaceae bacterium]
MARTDLRAHAPLRAPAALLAGLLASACTAGRIGSDVARVQTLSHVQQLPKVATEEVETTNDKDAHALLAAPLTESTAVRVALLNNRDLRADLRELGVSRGRLMQAGLVANPSFELEFLPERDSKYELRLEYNLSSLLLAPLASRAASSELEAQRYQVAARVVELGFEVRSAFYELAAAELRLSFARQTLDALTAGRDASLALLAAGNVPPLEASRQIVAYENARIEVAKIELDLADQREHMQRLLGLYGEQTEWRIAGAFGALPAELHVPDKLETEALRANLDLRAIEQRLVAAGRRTGIARASSIVPDVSVDGHALHVDGDPEHHHGESYWRYGAGVTVGVPLFDRQQGNMRIAEAEFDVLIERQQGLAIEVRSRAREARNRLVSTHARARMYESTLVPAQRTVMEQTLLQYNAMQLGVFELLAARRAQLEIELAYVDAQAAYWQVSAQLEALLAGKVVRHDGERADARTSAETLAGGH